MDKRLSICNDDCENCPITSCNFNPSCNLRVLVEGHRKAVPVPLETYSPARLEEDNVHCMDKDGATADKH
jgi:hypothetical protein